MPPTTTPTPADALGRRRRPTPVVVSTSADHERIVIRAPIGPWTTWTVALGAHGPEAHEAVWDQAAAPGAPAGAAPPPPPPPIPPPSPPPLEVEIPARFCGLDIASAGGDVTVGGAGVQEADVRIVAVDEEPATITTTSTAPTTTTTATTTISAEGRLRCGASLELDAGARGRVRAKELSAARLRVRGGAGVTIGRVSTLDALVEAGAGLEVGALYGRAARLRLSGGGGGNRVGGNGGGGAGGSPGPVPVLRVTTLSCEDDGADGDPEGGASLEAWPPGHGPIDVRVDGTLAGAARVASAGGPVSLAAVQAARLGAGGLAIDSGGGDVDISLDTGMTGGGGRGRGRGDAEGPAQQQQQQRQQQQQHEQQQQRPAASLRVRVAAGAAPPGVDPALGLVPSAPPSSSSPAAFEGLVPVSGGDGGGQLTVDAGVKGKVSLRARSWMDGVMAAARARRDAGGGGG